MANQTDKSWKADVLTATENYGKARTAFGQALAAAASAREAAMFGLGADFITSAGKTLTPEEAGNALNADRGGLAKGTRMTTGFSNIGRGLAGIAQEQAATVYAGDVEAQERGITTGSGIREQARAIAQDAGAAEKQKAIMEAQGQVAQAGAEEAAARAEERQALAELRTVQGKEMVKPKQKPKPQPRPQQQGRSQPKPQPAKPQAQAPKPQPPKPQQAPRKGKK